MSRECCRKTARRALWDSCRRFGPASPWIHNDTRINHPPTFLSSLLIFFFCLHGDETFVAKVHGNRDECTARDDVPMIPCGDGCWSHTWRPTTRWHRWRLPDFCYSGWSISTATWCIDGKLSWSSEINPYHSRWRRLCWVSTIEMSISVRDQTPIRSSNCSINLHWVGWKEGRNLEEPQRDREHKIRMKFNEMQLLILIRLLLFSHEWFHQKLHKQAGKVDRIF